MIKIGVKLLAATLLSAGLSIHGAGVIRGTVVDAISGGTLAGVHVMAMRSVAEMNPARAVPYRAITDEKGAYNLNAVEDGNYQVCATALSGYLDTCSWSSPVPARVASSTVDARIAMQRGVPLNVVFADQNGLLEKLRGKIPGGPITVDMTGSDGKRRIIPPDAADPGGFLTIVPADVPFTITVRTTAFSLADTTGRAIDASSGYRSTVRVAPPVVSPVPLMFNAGRRTIDFRLVFRIVGLTAEGQAAASK
ncbi:MAG: carboxypeptidase regulatory-like domain-containing protein [Acidobacteria bacterium]|nr:carboxypeptidase regulatory-like domain-containing protein [Acidobacteriota bacterium]